MCFWLYNFPLSRHPFQLLVETAEGRGASFKGMNLRFKSAVESFKSRKKPLDYNSRRRTLLKIHRQAYERYVPKAYPGKVTLFQTEGDLIAPDGYEKDPQWGWGELATGGLEIHIVPGRHFNVLVEPHIGVHGEKLRACIERALESTSGENS